MAVPMDLPLLDARGQALCCQDILTGQVHRRERRSAGAGSKGHRLYDRAMHAVRVKGQDPAKGFAHTLLIRRSKDMKQQHQGRPAPYGIEFFLVHAAVGTLAVMVRTGGCAVEDRGGQQDRVSQGKTRRFSKARWSAELGCPAAVDRRDPWVAGRDHAGSCCAYLGRDRPCLVAPSPSDHSHDQPLPPTR